MYFCDRKVSLKINSVPTIIEICLGLGGAAITRSVRAPQKWLPTRENPQPGGGGLPSESDGDARRKIRINTLKETNLGVAPALFNP